MPTDPNPAWTPDDALAALLDSPEFQAQMAALTQQATAQLNALVAALAQIEVPPAPPPPPEVTVLPAVEWTPLPFGDPLAGWPVVIPDGLYPAPLEFMAPAVMPPEYREPTATPPELGGPELGGPGLGGPGLGGSGIGTFAKVDSTEADMAALTRQAAEQVRALVDALRLAEAGMAAPPAPAVIPTAEEVTALLAAGESLDMLSLLAPLYPVPHAPAALAIEWTGAAPATEPAAIMWPTTDTQRHGAEGGNT